MRNSNPFAVMSLIKFIKQTLDNRPIGEPAHEHQFILTVTDRSDVKTRLWVEIQFTDAEGKRRTADSQEFDLALFRAAAMELDAMERADGEDQRAKLVRLMEFYQEQIAIYDELYPNPEK